jgi:hemerythrin superfamily protein
MANEAPEKNVIAVLVQDHDRIRSLFGEVQAARYADRRQEVAHELSALLVQHSTAEELFLYPEVRESVEDGAPRADRGLREHKDLERQLKKWRLGGDEEEFMAAFHELRAAVLQHIDEEEQDLFPALEAQIPVERLHELAIRIEQSERIGPTRPHPSAPHRPPVNKLLVPGMGIVDHLRDRFAGRRGR